MDWIQSLTSAIAYIEDHLFEEVSVDDVADRVYASSPHFQFIFHVVTGVTIGEYIRNRRLSLAARELTRRDSRIIDVAMRCQYDTQESFSKAFTRFHGVPPSRVRRDDARVFNRLRINVSIEEGFDMTYDFVDAFHALRWADIDENGGKEMSAEEKYGRIVQWAREARGQNPGVFDALTGWILDDSQWTEDKLAENEQVLMGGVLRRFKEQNARLRAYLNKLKPSGVVNDAVFGALDAFDAELAGVSHDEKLKDTVARVFADFSAMKDRAVRERIAGGVTGPTGTDTVQLFGYINSLKEDDAQVQWALFMPDTVKQQQNGFRVERFEYMKLPAMRFVGRELADNGDDEAKKSVFDALDALRAYDSEFNHDLFFMHHNGLGVDVGPWHGVWGRFMTPDAPVPEGFVSFDFTPDDNRQAGQPYVSQFAYATFSGDKDAMHKREGYDSDGMYDVTRNIILGQAVCIPYPEKYWTSEVCLGGWREDGTGYLFSVLL